MQRPSGTVTLVFSDVEDSTGLVTKLGDDYRSLIAEHRQLVRDAVRRIGGYEVDCRADEFFLAFSDVGVAVAVADEVQRASAAHPWPPGAAVRVRIGLHTGRPGLDDDNYVGLDVHRAARIATAGHGGQVLLSQTTRDQLLAREDARFPLKDLGEHRLRGLPRPERIFQLVLPGLESDFPPLRFTAPEPDDGAGGSLEEEQARMRVVLADDSILLREGIARLLAEAGFEVVGQASTADELVRMVGSDTPNVAVVDIRMPPDFTDEGIRATRTIREEHPDVGVLVLSQYAEPGYAIELLANTAEGVGYLLKDRVLDVLDFAAAVQRVGERGTALDPEVVSQLVRLRREDERLRELTAQERETLELMAEGRSNEEIADRLVSPQEEVERQVTAVFEKLGIDEAPDDHRRALAVLAYLRS